MPHSPFVEPVAALSEAEAARTARHISLVGLGDPGQRRLAGAHVAIVGAGGLGSPVVLALAAAGIGHLTIIDDDTVDLSNLQRQVIHRHRDVGAPKVDSVVRVAADVSPETIVSPVQERITADSAMRLFSTVDVVVDGSDNFETRAVVADACEALGLPLVWGVVQEFAAQVTVFWSQPPEGYEPIRLSDVYPPESVGEPPSCAAVGVLGALCIQVGGLMALETIKLIAATGEILLGRLIVIDGLRGTQREIRLHPRDEPDLAAPSAGLAPVHDAIREVTLDELRTAQSAGATVLDVREPVETAAGTLAGAVILPLGEVLAGREPEGSPPFVVVCARGSRARAAAIALRERGVDAVVLAGGLAAWQVV